MFLTYPAAASAVQQAAQHVGRIDAYELISAAAALCSGLGLLARMGLRPADARSWRTRRVDEVLACVAALSIGVLLLHQLVTDGVCHGACTFS